MIIFYSFSKYSPTKPLTFFSRLHETIAHILSLVILSDYF